MPVFKRGKYYCTRFKFGKKKIVKSTGTTDKIKAQEYEDKLRAELWEQKQLGKKPSYTWDQAALKWLEECEKRSIDKDMQMIESLLPIMSGLVLNSINHDVLKRIQKTLLSTPYHRKNQEPRYRTKSTVNRIMALVRSILNKCAGQWKWLDTTPVVPMYSIEDSEPKWLTKNQFEEIVKHLPRHAANIARFAVLTGLRIRNITYLKWAQIDLDNRHAYIPSSKSKNKKPIAVPLNTETVELLKSVEGDHYEYVFVQVFKKKDRDPRPIDRINKTWAYACNKAGLTGYRVHDLRHTWASWHVQSGTPLHILKELGGWSQLSMVERYGHLSSKDLANYAENSSKSGNKK